MTCPGIEPKLRITNIYAVLTKCQELFPAHSASARLPRTLVGELHAFTDSDVKHHICYQTLRTIICYLCFPHKEMRKQRLVFFKKKKKSGFTYSLAKVWKEKANFSLSGDHGGLTVYRRL